MGRGVGCGVGCGVGWAWAVAWAEAWAVAWAVVYYLAQRGPCFGLMVGVACLQFAAKVGAHSQPVLQMAKEAVNKCKYLCLLAQTLDQAVHACAVLAAW